MTLSFKDFMEQNEIMLEDLAREGQGTFFQIAGEKYQDYLESIEDRDND
jgi:hypothetical protein